MLKRLMSAMHAPIYDSRLRELVRVITPHIRAGDRVLDVGCGGGTLGANLRDNAPEGVVVEGLERHKRGGEPIEVLEYNGTTIPMDDGTYDLVILADVLHHEENPDRLLAECARVSRRNVVVKDHQEAGPLAHARVSLIDWAANAPYDVKCLYRYHSPRSWADLWRQHELRVVEEHTSMNLYPPLVNLAFGRRLQYLAVLEVRRPAGVTADLRPPLQGGAATA